MTVITSGRISITPVILQTKATLPEIHVAMSEELYKGKIPTSGWGSVHDDDDLLETGVPARPKPKLPELLADDGIYPDEVRARLYWDQTDLRALELLGPDGDKAKIYSLRAADIFVVDSDDPNEKFAYVSLGATARELQRDVVPRLLELVQEVDESASISSSSDGIGFADDDFFRWLTYRAFEDPQLTDDFHLDIVRDIVARDVHNRSTTIAQGITNSRPEVLTMLARPSVTFGPAKLAITDSALLLTADFQLRQDGGFVVTLSATHYDDPEILPSEVRLQIVKDLAFIIIPQLRSLYYADQSWNQQQRDKFISKSLSDLGITMGLTQPLP